MEEAATRPTFDAIMREREAQLLRIAYRMLGNWADAEDVAQESLVRLHRQGTASFPDGAAAGAWVCRVAVNLCLDRLRSRSRWRMTGDIPEGMSYTGESAEDTTLRGEQKRLVAAALGRLPERERAALVLREIEGLSTEETAAAMGSSVATVRSQVSKAIGRLREMLGA